MILKVKLFLFLLPLIKLRKLFVIMVSRAKFGPPPRRHHTPNFFPACHYHGKIGHIQPMCFMLRPREHVNENSYQRNNYEGLFEMMMVVLNRLDELEIIS